MDKSYLKIKEIVVGQRRNNGEKKQLAGMSIAAKKAPRMRWVSTVGSKEANLVKKVVLISQKNNIAI